MLMNHGVDRAVGAYVQYVVRTIQAIKFAILWRECEGAAEGRKWKSEYREGLFLSEQSDEISRITESTVGKQRNSRLASLRRCFIARHEKLVTSHNHVRKLYTTVGLSGLLLLM